MEKNNLNVYNKLTIIIIIILFMISSNIRDITWNIGKSLLYIICILYLINYLNPIIANQIKEIIVDFINIGSESNFIKDVISNGSLIIMNLFRYLFNSKNNNIKSNTNFDSNYNPNIKSNTNFDSNYNPNTSFENKEILMNIPRQLVNSSSDYGNRNMDSSNKTLNRQLSMF